MAIITVPITKAKQNIPVETDSLPEEMYALALAEGLKVILNKNMSKAGPVKDVDDEELAKTRAKAMEIAQENFENLMAGNLKKRKAAGKESRAVTTEARRLAREAVKAAFKEAGKKLSGIKASVITAAADELIAEDDSYVVKARENVAKMAQRESVHVAPKEGTSLAALIAQADTAKPKVAPTRKKKEGDVPGAIAKGKKGKTEHQAAH